MAHWFAAWWFEVRIIVLRQRERHEQQQPGCAQNSRHDIVQGRRSRPKSSLLIGLHVATALLNYNLAILATLLR